MVETTNFVALDGAARKALRKVVDLHEKRLAGGGDRTCVAVDGERLSLASVRLASNGTDLTDRMTKGSLRGRYFLASSVEIPDCASTLTQR
jgi:hypothetical protein